MKITVGILFYWIGRNKNTQHICHHADRMEIREISRFREQREIQPGILYLLPEKNGMFLLASEKKLSLSKEKIQNLKNDAFEKAQALSLSFLEQRKKNEQELYAALLKEWNLLLGKSNLLLEKIASQESATEILSCAEKLLRTPFVLVDRDMQLLYGSERLARVMAEQLGEGYSTELIEELMMSKDFHNVATAKEPFYYYMNVTDQHSYCLNILVDGNYYARLVVNTEKGETKLPSGAEQIAEYLAAQIVRMIKNGSLRLHQDQNDRMHLICGQIAGGMRPEKEEIEKALIPYGGTSPRAYQVFCLEPFRAVGWDTQMETTLPVMTRKLEQLWPDSCAATSGTQILWLVLRPKAEGEEDTYAFFQQLQILLRENVFRAGVSSRFSDITLLPNAFDQASSALWIGSGKNESYWFFRFDDYRLDYMLDALRSREMDRSLLAHPAVAALAEYDQQHESQLKETLRVFIEKRQNVTQAAEELFVHRTTLFRRLHQIRDLTGIDFEDEKEMLTLQLSYYLLEK